MSIAPDSNITSASDEETIFIDLGGVDLPFERNPAEVETSGVGVRIWTGGEYQHPLGNRLRRRKAALHVDPELATPQSPSGAPASIPVRGGRRKGASAALDSRCTRGRSLHLHRACPMSIGCRVRPA